MTTKLIPFGNFPLLPQDIFEDFTNSFFDGLEVYNPKTRHFSLRSFPRGDVFIDKDGNRVIELALAGYSKEQLSIVVKDNQLTVSAEKCERDDDEDSGVQRTLARRAFKQTFSNLGESYDLSKSDVSFVDGLLKIVVPKSEESEEARLEIK